MDNYNSLGVLVLRSRNHAEENYNNRHAIFCPPQVIQELAEFHRPPMCFNCVTAEYFGTRSSSILLQIPKVPFIVKRRLFPGFPTTAVAFGVVPLGLCEDYEGFMSLLRDASRVFRRDTSQGPPSREDPVPGYRLWYETMRPVRVRVPFYTHSWSTFKDRVGFVVLENRGEELCFDGKA